MNTATLISEANTVDIHYLVNNLTYKEKITRALTLIEQAYDMYGDRLVVANSLGKDSVVVWHLVKQVSTAI